MGPPGSGKGTQATRLSESRNLRHVSTGEILRRAVRSRTELGHQVEGVLQSGGLVSDDLMMGLMSDALTRLHDQKEGWLLDGFPRTAPQAAGLVAILTEKGIVPPIVLNIVVPEEEIVERLSGRLTCSDGNHVAPKGSALEGDPCPECGADLYIRNDDKPETVRNRLKVFHEKTEEALAALVDVYRVVDVDGLGTPAQVTERIRVVLEAAC